MKYQEFLGQVQARARLPSPDAAVKATRATLMTLGERLLDPQAHHLAAQLPEELALMLEDRGQESFGFDEFIARVSEREHVSVPQATYHARVVLEVLGEAISPGSLDKLRNSMPPELRLLLEGSDGHMPKPT
jgi:uncharacterized protein (DUF2267 family)